MIIVHIYMYEPARLILVFLYIFIPFGQAYVRSYLVYLYCSYYIPTNTPHNQWDVQAYIYDICIQYRSISVLSSLVYL